MIKEIVSYIKKHIKWIILYLVFGLIFFLVLMLYNAPTEAVQYAFILCGLVIVLFVGLDFFRYHIKCQKTENLLANIAVDVEAEDAPGDLIEALYREAVEKLFEEKVRIDSESRIGKKEMIDYYSLWVHQIKTPIAAMRILLQTENELSFSRKSELEMELFKIEQYVEMVLSYIRMGDMTSDLKLQWYKIDEIVKPAIRKYSKLFIGKKIRLNYESIENRILTDEKWLGFVIEQLLSNALKYTNEGAISIYMEPGKQNILVIEDTGIGIWKEDLPRVFEKGFTGYNGRTDKKSTGIGLYLCKTIIDKLNHCISISSEVSKGTKIFLNLNRDDCRKE